MPKQRITKTFPKRPPKQRCFKCRRYFAWNVVEGMFCSYECAKRPTPSTNPDDWPRQHFTPARPGRPKRAKTYYANEAEAKVDADPNGKTAYLCTYCSHWHVGSLAPGVKKEES